MAGATTAGVRLPAQSAGASTGGIRLCPTIHNIDAHVDRAVTAVHALPG